MCHPAAIMIAGMAMSAAGSAYSSKQQSKNVARMVGARNAATASNFARQDAFQREAEGQFGDVLAKFKPGQQRVKEAQAGQRRAKVAADSTSTGGRYGPVSGSAPAIVKGEIGRKVGQANAKAGAQAGRGAKIAALGDLNFGNVVDLGRSRGKIGQTGSFSAGTANLLPLEQSAAEANAYKAPGILGPLLQIGGQALSAYGTSGGSFGAGGGGIPGPTYGPYGKAGIRPY